jgi:hypothetical protein
MTLLTAIRTLEKACLSKDSTPTTPEELRTNTEAETKSYYQWLRVQASQTAMFTPFFDQLTHKPSVWNK